MQKLALNNGRHVDEDRAILATSLDLGLDWESSTGSLRGRSGDFSGLGILPEEHRPDTVATYVVYSYATPIAWTTPEGQWTVPDVRYSATTSRHQTIVRAALPYSALANLQETS